MEGRERSPGLGGFVFLGSFELAKRSLSRGRFAGEHSATPGHAFVRKPSQFGSAIEPPPPTAQAKVEHPQAAPPTAPAKVDHPQVPAANADNQSSLGEEAPLVVNFLSGLFAGIAVDVPLHPVDTVKTRLQAREGFASSGGFRGLWSGLSAVLLTSVPGSAIFFVVYERSRHLVEQHTPVSYQGQAHAIWRDAAAASLADVSACVVRVPCEVLKQRMQTRRLNSPPSTLTGTIKSVNAGGLRGFFAGFGATVTREVPFALIQMSLFEEMKRRHPWSGSDVTDPKLQGAIGMSCGSCAGAISGALTTPLDAAKTRIMLTEQHADRRGLVPTMASLYVEGGMRGLFKGVVPRTIHCGIGGALWLGSFEVSKLFAWKLYNMPTF